MVFQLDWYHFIRHDVIYFHGHHYIPNYGTAVRAARVFRYYGRRPAGGRAGGLALSSPRI